MKKAKRILESLTDSEKSELLIELSSDETLDESEQFEIDLIGEYSDGIDEVLDHWGQHDGLDFGYDGINAMTLGMTDGEVLLLSGDSNHGKTQLALNLAYKQAKAGNLVFFITLEMTQAQIGGRIAKIAMQDGMTRDDAKALTIAVQKTRSINYKNVPSLVAKGKRMGASIVFIDHIHSFRPDSATSKTQEIAAISDAIKRAALENLIPIVALCQCRKLEDASGKSRKPTKNDLKDASELYQDCDICIMVWRDKEDPNADSDLVEARIWKNRLRPMRKGHIIKTFRSVEGASMKEVPDYANVFPK